MTGASAARSAPARAIVFGHGDMGVRGLLTLLSNGVEVPLVVGHEPDANEGTWYGNLIETARGEGIRTATPLAADLPALLEPIAALAPDFIFSFYYRSLIPAPMLALARSAALNMHGSLLPAYRGRAPLNWAILRGERWTGVTLHHMVARADAGDIVDQLAVPILANDDARQVFGKMCVAGEVVLARSLPALLAGNAPRTPQRIEDGFYVGRRGPEDGRLDWNWTAQRLHDLVRAVAPPFPGAFADVAGERWGIHRTRVLAAAPHPAVAPNAAGTPVPAPRLVAHGAALVVECADGSRLRILEAANARGAIDIAQFVRRVAQAPIALA
jgi:methionyl-tRNA formyltransferase